MTRFASRTRLAAVAAAAVLTFSAAACGSSTSTSTPTTAGSSATASMSVGVRIVNFSFQPQTVTVKVGGTVTWTQVDQTGHSVESTTGAWTTSAVLKPGQTFKHTFTKAGTYPYICGVHNYMTGTVDVVG